jgi:broad specificity phosphatase PhoE
MTDTQIHLLRHGEAQGGNRYRGVTDDPLTEKGWQQMWSAVEEGSWDRVITSPLSRCADFAKAFAESRSIPFEVVIDLHEVDFGDWDGRSAEDIWAEDAEALQRFWQDPITGTPLGGEPLGNFQKRVMLAWSDIISEYRGERLLIITHGGVIRVILCELQELPLERLLEIEVPHASLHCITPESQ